MARVDLLLTAVEAISDKEMIFSIYIAQLDHFTPSNREEGLRLFVSRRSTLSPGHVRQFNFLFLDGILSFVFSNLVKLPVKRVDLVNKNYISGTYRDVLCVLINCLVNASRAVEPTARFF